MTPDERLSEVFRNARNISFEYTDKIILFSDCHRGDNSWADDFAPNQNVLFHALEHYYNEGFTYIELGDGDELWENRNFTDIRNTHSHIFWIMQQFYKENRLHMIYGNHDMERKDPAIVRKTLHEYYDERSGTVLPLFDGINVFESIALRHRGSGRRILLAHGHQADPFNDQHWQIGRFFVRHFWRHMQLLGIKNPTSPAKNLKKRSAVEQSMLDWCKANGQMLIAGHTHRARFPKPGEIPYFNTGSCIHPRCITGVEIQSGEVLLVKWAVEPNENALLFVAREILDHQPIQAYL